MDERDGEALARAMESWQPFPDTVPALRAGEGRRPGLWIISNTDRAIMDHTLRHLELDFDGVTVAEDCARTARRAPFDRALRDMGVSPPRTAAFAKYDIATVGGSSAQTAWVNRHREPAPGPEQPDHEWTDLWPLAEVA